MRCRNSRSPGAEFFILPCRKVHFKIFEAGCRDNNHLWDTTDPPVHTANGGRWSQLNTHVTKWNEGLSCESRTNRSQEISRRERRLFRYTLKKFLDQVAASFTDKLLLLIKPDKLRKKERIAHFFWKLTRNKISRLNRGRKKSRAGRGCHRPSGRREHLW